MKADTRLKIHKLFKKYGKIVAIAVIIWISIVFINKFLEKNSIKTEPTTTYTPHTAVLDGSGSVPKKIQNSIEEFVEEYVEYCNTREYEKAYNMISDDCKDFFGSFAQYKSYVSNKFGSKKIYSIQNYSNYDDKYIYTVKLYDDILASGLTNSTYMYQEEKIIASNENGKVVFSVGNFVEKKDITSVQENKYLKIDIKNRISKYNFEIYEIKLTNRSENTIVVENGFVENEVLLNLGEEYRTQVDATEIILEPNETRVVNLTFEKFYDNGLDSKSIIFNSIRVVENYIEDNPNEENSIDKFSMELGLE